MSRFLVVHLQEMWVLVVGFEQFFFGVDAGACGGPFFLSWQKEGKNRVLRQNSLSVPSLVIPRFHPSALCLVGSDSWLRTAW
jgi:hypothetical protein